MQSKYKREPFWYNSLMTHREMANALKNSMHAPINYDKSEAEGDNVSNCYENAPMIEGVKFPLIMFNHGLSSYREVYSWAGS